MCLCPCAPGLWHLYACGSHGKWVCAQCLTSVFNNSHSWETTPASPEVVPLNVPVFMSVYECVHVFVFTRMGLRGVEGDAGLSICIYCDVSENTLLKCRSPGCAYSLRDAYNVHRASHYSHLECVHDFYWKNRLRKWKSRKHFDFRPPELHLGTFVAWKVYKASNPE